MNCGGTLQRYLEERTRWFVLYEQIVDTIRQPSEHTERSQRQHEVEKERGQRKAKEQMEHLRIPTRAPRYVRVDALVHGDVKVDQEEGSNGAHDHART